MPKGPCSLQLRQFTIKFHAGRKTHELNVPAYSIQLAAQTPPQLFVAAELSKLEVWEETHLAFVRRHGRKV
jgi:hypothetical protein